MKMSILMMYLLSFHVFHSLLDLKGPSLSMKERGSEGLSAIFRSCTIHSQIMSSTPLHFENPAKA